MADTVTISNSHESELQFDVSVEGTDVSEMRVRFVVAGPKGANYSFNCKQSDEAGKWAVTIPPMPHLPVGKYDFTVEVITNGYYFDPYKGTIEVTPKPAVSTSSKKPTAPTVKVSASTSTKKEEDEDVSWTAPVISEEDEAKKKADDLVAAFMKSREEKAPLTEKEKAIKDALKDFKKNRPPKREAPKAPPKKKVEEKVVEEKQDTPIPEPTIPRRSNLSSVIEKLDQPKDEQARKIHDIIKGTQ